MRELPTDHAKAAHPYAWLWEPLEGNPTFALRSMFGSKGAYMDGKMMVCFCTRRDPWRGLLVCTDRGHHASLMSDFPALKPHPILGKWLHLPDSNDEFDRTAERIIRLILRHDPRIGIIPRPKKKKLRKEPGAPSRTPKAVKRKK